MAQRIRKETYERLADLIDQARGAFHPYDGESRAGVDRVALVMADDFQNSDPNFKRALWLLQAGVRG